MDENTAEVIITGLFLLTVAFIVAITLHENQHMQDFKELNCTKIQNHAVYVTAECPDIDRANNLSLQRDKDFFKIFLKN